MRCGVKQPRQKAEVRRTKVLSSPFGLSSSPFLQSVLVSLFVCLLISFLEELSVPSFSLIAWGLEVFCPVLDAAICHSDSLDWAQNQILFSSSSV